MKKKILWAVLIIAIGFVGYQTYIFTLAEEDNIQPIYLVPKNAAFVFETERPIDTWDEISASNIWKHFQTNTYFKNLTESLDNLDKTFQEQKQIIDFIGERDLLISVHVYKPKKFDFLYVADLQKLAKLNFLKNAIAKLAGDSYKITKRVYKSHEILELYDKKSRETLHITFIKNQLVDMIMSAHVVNKNLDYSLPATLSWNINTKLLRKDLGYKGVLISDDLQMYAISKHYSLDDTVKLAINSGIDMLMFANQLAKPLKLETIIDSVYKQVRSGKIKMYRIKEANQRIDTLKKKG